MTPQTVLHFWFNPNHRALWFQKSIRFDTKVISTFKRAYHLALRGKYQHWTKTAQGTLALIIIMDQFSRNMFRNNPKSFYQDSVAIDLCKFAISKGYHHKLSPQEQAFLYMPLMHSEYLQDQALSVRYFKRLGRKDNLEFAIEHQKIIAEFGRFPHRNKVLGRPSTKEELVFLQTHKGF